jgi:L-threonylcarbamoyladenylate synthase
VKGKEIPVNFGHMQTVVGQDIGFAAELLRAGNLVAIPTETVYGLAANGLDEEAVLRIYEAKQRPRFNPLILHLADAGQLERYASELPGLCRRLAEAFSPGPITFLLPKKPIVPDLVTAGSDQVALRIPAHPMALELLSRVDLPLAAPSANPFGYVSPVTAQHVLDGLGGRIPYILDGGPCPVGLESTIVGFPDGDLVIHRLGGLSQEEIEMVAGRPARLSLGHSRPEAPGQLTSHYAPHAPLWLGNIDVLRQVHQGKRMAVISFSRKYQNPEPAWSFVLSPSGSLHEAARNLFSVLRQIDKLEVDIILAEPFPEAGLGRAINDRLQRAQVIHKS